VQYRSLQEQRSGHRLAGPPFAGDSEDSLGLQVHDGGNLPELLPASVASGGIALDGDRRRKVTQSDPQAHEVVVTTSALPQAARRTSATAARVAGSGEASRRRVVSSRRALSS